MYKIECDGERTIATKFEGSKEQTFYIRGTGYETAVEALNLLFDKTPFDWNGFKKGNFLVQVSEERFDEFIKETAKHGCYFFNNINFNPFKDFSAMLLTAFDKLNCDDESKKLLRQVFLLHMTKVILK